MRGRAVQADTPVAYRPFAEALCSVVRAGAAPDATELDPFRAVLARLIPEWRIEGDALADDSVVALAEGLLRFLRATAGDRGCLLVLEDLHWADPETLTIVEYLVDNLASERVLVVVTIRDDARSSALDLARIVKARRAAEVVELSRLGPEAVAEVVGACLDTAVVPDGVLRCARRAEGVPFLIEELLASAVLSGALVRDGESWRLASVPEPVPPLTFSESIRRRLETLGDTPRTVLTAAAVLGGQFDWELLPAITELDEATVLAALHAAVDAQLIAVDAAVPAFRFRHGLSRDAVLAQLLPPERVALSRRALAHVDVSDAGTPEDRYQLAARLALAGGERRQAAEFLLAVAQSALRAGALASAESALDAAADAAPTGDPIFAAVEESLLEVLSHAGNRDRALAVGRSLVARLGDDEAAATRRGLVHLRMARAAAAATHWDEVRERLDLARGEAARARDEQLECRVDALDALAALGQDDLEEAASLASSALVAAERLGMPEVMCEALEAVGRCRRPFDLAAAEAAFRRAHAIADRHGLAIWRLRALHELGTIDLLRDGDTARLETARDLAVSVGALTTAAVLENQICGSAVLGDDPDQALVGASRAGDIARKYGLRQTRAIALGFQAMAHGRAGRRRAMEDCLRQAADHAGDEPSMAVVAACARAMAAFATDDRAAALSHLDRPDVVTQGPIPGWWALLQAVDSAEGASAVATVRAGDEPVHFLARAYLHYADAVIHGRAGRLKEAAASVAAGDRLLQGFNWARHLGHRLLAEAAAVDAWGDPVTWLREAEAFFEQRAEASLATACRSLLRRLGAPLPRRRLGAGPLPEPLRAMGVTAREAEVLALVGEGLSNPEIAERLYISARTVEKHVERLMAKAGVSTRRALVPLAERLRT
jgi:DNA-binding CsgD family transcriptional regulator